jgi:hypothetical protein
MDARQKAQIAKMQEDAHSIEVQVNISRTEYLGLMTGQWCTDCYFSITQTMQSQPSALAINAASWAPLGFSTPPLDPWGNPYTIDENEGEPNFPSELCRYDMVYSAGPDGIYLGNVNSGAGSGITQTDFIYAEYGDNYSFALTFWNCPAPN